jgi:hypothetical protein
MSRRLLSQRMLFTGTLSVLATVFGSYLSVVRISGQIDILSDIVKIGSIIAVGSVLLSFIFWTLMHISRRPPCAPLRGAIAGLLTAFCVVPLPVFGWKLKTELVAAFADGSNDMIGAFFAALPMSLYTGFQTYEVMTKASVAALISSAALGYLVARFGPEPPPAGTSPHQR